MDAWIDEQKQRWRLAVDRSGSVWFLRMQALGLVFEVHVPSQSPEWFLFVRDEAMKEVWEGWLDYSKAQDMSPDQVAEQKRKDIEGFLSLVSVAQGFRVVRRGWLLRKQGELQLGGEWREVWSALYGGRA